jgi:hypothetical protein
MGMAWDVVLVADCVYDEGLTDHLFGVLRALLKTASKQRQPCQRQPCLRRRKSDAPVMLPQSGASNADGTALSGRHGGGGSNGGDGGLGGRGGTVVWLTLEKRFNFELATLSVQAFGYRRFLAHIGQLPGQLPGDDAPRTSSGGGGPRLSGRRLSVDQVPQCFDYRRVPQLELWEIALAD